MSLFTIAKGLTLKVPSTALSLAQEGVSRALGTIYDQTDWSFQKAFGGWLAPGMVFNSGTTTTTPYSPTIICDDYVTGQMVDYMNAGSYPLITQLQYRNPSYDVYDIISLGTTDTVGAVRVTSGGSGQTPGQYTVSVADGGPGTGATVLITVDSTGVVTEPPTVLTPGSGYVAPFVTVPAGGTPATLTVYLNITLTLDRPWLEPTSGPGQPFWIYQVYYVAPVQDFRKFIQISDPTNYQYIDFWSATQADLAVWDPARRDFSIPRFCVPAGPDLRQGSATYGWQRFELWPHQGNYIPYEFEYRRRGALPQNPTDYLNMSPPYPITEEMVDWRAKEILFQEKSAQMEERVPGSGKGMMMLSQSAQKEFMYLFGQALSIDLNLDGEQQHHKIRRGRYNRGTPYAGMNGTINLGGYPNN